MSKLETKIVSLLQFETLEDFRIGQNNYYAYFLNDCKWGKRYRKKIHFKRFKEAYPKMEKELTCDMVYSERILGGRWNLSLNQEMKFWESYKLMSQLVFIDDPNVIRNGEPDKYFLTR